MVTGALTQTVSFWTKNPTSYVAVQSIEPPSESTPLWIPSLNLVFLVKAGFHSFRVFVLLIILFLANCTVSSDFVFLPTAEFSLFFFFFFFFKSVIRLFLFSIDPKRDLLTNIAGLWTASFLLINHRTVAVPPSKIRRTL